jgi:hypothetical protein
MIQTKTFAVVFLTAIAAMGATVTAGIFLQHANAANVQNQEHCDPNLSGNGCVNTPSQGPNSMGTCGNNFGGSSCTSQTQLTSPVPTQQGANTLTAHVHVVGGCNGEGARCVGSNTINTGLK